MNKKALFSFEIFPPKPNNPIEAISGISKGLTDLNPDYISITYGAGGLFSGTCETLELAYSLENKFKTKTLVHLTSIHNGKEDVDNFLNEMNKKGLSDVLALRGDRQEGKALSSDFVYASDLIKYINAKGNFNIAAACCPEGHIESKSLNEDIKYLKLKVDFGATHLNSQMCFDNEEFYRFLDRAQKASINVPIQAGIMPVVRAGQIERIITLSGVKFPSKFSRIIAKYANNPIALKDAGIAYATEQIIDLLTAGVDGVHLYVMNNVEVAERITKAVKSFL